MKTFVNAPMEDLQKLLEKELKEFAHKVEDEYNIKMNRNMLWEIEARVWSIESTLFNQTVSPWDILRDVSFRVIQMLGLHPILDEAKAKWRYTFPQNADPEDKGTVSGWGETSEEAARHFYTNWSGGAFDNAEQWMATMREKRAEARLKTNNKL